jgi:hypothetical protein
MEIYLNYLSRFGSSCLFSFSAHKIVPLIAMSLNNRTPSALPFSKKPTLETNIQWQNHLGIYIHPSPRRKKIFTCSSRPIYFCHSVYMIKRGRCNHIPKLEMLNGKFQSSSACAYPELLPIGVTWVGLR